MTNNPDVRFLSFGKRAVLEIIANADPAVSRELRSRHQLHYRNNFKKEFNRLIVEMIGNPKREPDAKLVRIVKPQSCANSEIERKGTSFWPDNFVLVKKIVNMEMK